MRIKVWVSVGLVGCKKCTTVDVDDESWREMSDEDKEAEMRDCAYDMFDWGYEEIPANNPNGE